jgi:hypothetical protein
MTWNQGSPVTAWDGTLSTWMTQLPDDLLVRDLSIPGTHDSAALKGWTGLTRHQISETQAWTIEQQLANGIRFLDLRVKIQFQHKGLAMYHGIDPVYDSEDPGPDNLNQLDYQKVIGKCVQFLKQHPKEGIIVSLKSEGDTTYDGRTIEDWFREIANNVAWDNHETWDKRWDVRPGVDATLKDIRGRLLLWRRFPRGGRYNLNYAEPFALDLTAINDSLDNADGEGWINYNIQDKYKKTDCYHKFMLWFISMLNAYDSRWKPNHPNGPYQYINFSSLGAGGTPLSYQQKIGPALEKVTYALVTGQDMANGKPLGGPPRRSGIGVVPMDFPDPSTISHMIKSNFVHTQLFLDPNAYDLTRTIPEEQRMNTILQDLAVKNPNAHDFLTNVLQSLK